MRDALPALAGRGAANAEFDNRFTTIPRLNMPRKRSKDRRVEDVEHLGLSAVLRERYPGGPIQFDCTIDGERDRHSTGTKRWDEAWKYAETYLQERALHRIGVEAPSPQLVTLGELLDLFRRHKLPTLDEKQRAKYGLDMLLFEVCWGRRFRVAELDQSAVDRFAIDRKAGKLQVPKDEREGRRWLGPVGDTTVYGSFANLRAIFNWCRKKRVSYGWALRENPLDRVKLPAPNRNAKQPVASHERFRRTIETADAVDPGGRLRVILHLLRYTGRRVSSVCRLRVSDIVLGKEALARALAEAGFSEEWADIWVHGAIFWRAEYDKRGVGYPVPIGADTAALLRAYLRELGALGETWMFPNPRHPSRPVTKDGVGMWIVRAEEMAGLSKIRGGRTHPYRRLWRSERAELFHDKLVALVGGWQYRDENSGSLNDGYLKFGDRRILDCAAFRPGAHSHNRSHTA